MFKHIVIAFIGFLLLISSSFAEPIALKAELANKMEAVRTDYHLPGLALTVRYPSGQVIEINSGKTGLDSLKPITQDTLFQVGSTTKFFTASLILKLVEMNVLSLDDPLSKWLPNYPHWSNITILQLLNHTSGIYDYINSRFWWFRLDWFPHKVWQPEDLVAIAYRHPLYFPTGNGWHYSNTDYVLLGMIVEKATHQSFESVLDSLILSRMQPSLSHTYYLSGDTPDDIKQQLAQGYRNGQREMTDINTSWLQAGGALNSNPDDLSSAYATIFSGKILSADSLKKLTTFVSIENGMLSSSIQETSYGLGVFRVLSTQGIIWFTPGLTPGYTSMVAWMPCDKIAFSYAMNTSTEKPGLHTRLLTDIIQVLSEQSSPRCLNQPAAIHLQFPHF